MATGLEGVAAKARREANLQFTSLCHHINRGLIWKSLCSIPNDSAPGVDVVTVERARRALGYGLRRCYDLSIERGTKRRR